MPPSIRLLALDIDGTLLDHHNPVDPIVLDALCRANRAGIQIVLATGRSVRLIPPELSSLPFLRYIICSNGAVLKDTHTNQLLDRHSIPPNLLGSVLEAARNTDGAFILTLESSSIVEAKALQRCNSDRMNFPSDWILTETRPVFEILHAVSVANECVFKVVCFYESVPQATTARKYFNQINGIELVTTTGKDWEIGSSGVTKGNGIAKIAELLGIRRSEVAAIGDSGNDLSMRCAVGQLIAMGNASESLKTVADWVTEPVSACGVAVAIDRLIKA